MKNKKLYLFGGGVLVVAALFGINAFTPGDNDALAQCIADSGATFYGAFWCPHCQSQKQAFGKSQRLLPYVECSTPDGQGQLQVCTDATVQSYPTWEFADGERMSGELPLTTLAEKTGCEAHLQS